MWNFGKMFNGMFKQVADGYCRISMDGQIAIKTPSGYKTYDIANKRLVNCDEFAFDMDGMFWLVPTFKIEKGDIILVNDKPNCVIEVSKDSIKTFSYLDSTINEVIPEHHVFMGKTYCYGKIFSPFINMSKNDNSLSSMMQMMMMSKMFSGSGSSNDFNPMMFMMMGDNNPFSNMFEGAFNFGNETESEE